MSGVDSPALPSDLVEALRTLDPAEPLLVALDFDGTLSALVPVPSEARPLPGVLDLLERLGHLPGTQVALVSGRALVDLAAVSGAAGIALLVGSHGQQMGADRPLDAAEATLLREVHADVEAAVAGIEGVRVEDKPTGLAVHVRQCAPADQVRAEDAVRAVLARRPGLHVIEGKMVVEMSVRPLDKGAALRTLIEAAPGRRVLFAGDDVTDEAAIAALRPDDVSIKVGLGASGARFRVPDPHAMVAVLAALVAGRGG